MAHHYCNNYSSQSPHQDDEVLIKEQTYDDDNDFRHQQHLKMLMMSQQTPRTAEQRSKNKNESSHPRHHVFIRRPERRRRQRELAAAFDDALSPLSQQSHTSNAFASLEALLQQEPSSRENAHPEENVTAAETAEREIFPPSPSTLSNGSGSLDRETTGNYTNAGGESTDAAAADEQRHPKNPRNTSSTLHSPPHETTTQHHHHRKPFRDHQHVKKGTENNVKDKIREEPAVLVKAKKKRTAKVTHNPKSIVGSRPKHWGAPPPRHSMSQVPRQDGHPFLQTSRQKRRAELAAELSRGRRRAKVQPPPKPGTATGKAAAAEVSYAPAFLKVQSPPPPPSGETPAVMEIASASSTPDNAVDSTVDQGNIFLPTAAVLSPFSSPPPVGKKAAAARAGPLAKRLKSIRDNIKGDCIRFQSGQYPFSVRSVNPNDPRNRADSICNVTVVGNPIVSDKQHLIVLAVVHEWTTTANAEPAQCMMKGLAWMSFTFETAREQKLAKGSQLRIYNAVPIQIASSAQQEVKWMVIATQLCEPYPAHVLPALPLVAS